MDDDDDLHFISHQNLLQQGLECLFLSLPLLLFLIKQGRRKRSRLPPGPWRLPVVGNLHQVGANPHLALRALAERHGPLMFLQLGSIPTVVISSAHVAGEALRAHDLAFAGRPTLYAAERLSYGLRDVAFAPHGEYWRQARKMFMVEMLSAKRVRSFRGGVSGRLDPAARSLFVVVPYRPEQDGAVGNERRHVPSGVRRRVRNRRERQYGSHHSRIDRANDSIFNYNYS
ncbi:cytochrome P450 71A9-like [Musa acuminata AAA Group]|uniref:cytochrome P450 71A9-like n=1 Tax=Musa acuminata AAA Group TaxID=214697 RepID=UPI0031D543A6